MASRIAALQRDQADSDHQETNPIPNHTKKLGNSQFATYLKSQPPIAPYIHSIQQYLSSHGQHKFYLNSLLSYWCGRSLQKLEKLVKKQSESLLQGKSFLHKINKAIVARYRCLQKIKRELSKVEHILGIFKKAYFQKNSEADQIYLEYTQKQGYTPIDIDETVEGSIQIIKNLFMDLRQLRGMTVYIIETVHRWRIEIEEWMDKCNRHSRIDYFVIPSSLSPELQQQPRTIYQIIGTDTDFIFMSRLRQHVWFQYKSDPLIIRNVLNLVEKQRERQVLEKYFIQFLYPTLSNGQQDTLFLDQCVHCLEMLSFQYQLKLSNLYAEEQKLIENYLSLQRMDNEEAGFHLGEQEDQNKFDEKQKQRYRGLLKSGIFEKKNISRVRVHNAQIIKNSKVTRREIERDHEIYYGDTKEEKKDWVSVKNRGWVFGKQLKKPSSDRIRQLVKKHELEMQHLKTHKNMIGNFNKLDHPRNQSIALAYLSQQKNKDQFEREKNSLYQPYLQKLRTDKDFSRRVNKKSLSDSQQNLKSGALQMSRGKMHQSLIKFQNHVIFEDPKEYEQAQTPKNTQNQRMNKEQIHRKLNKSAEKQTKTEAKLHFSSVKDKVQKRSLSRESFKHPQNKLQNDDQARKTVHHKIKVNSLVGQELEKVQKQEINVDGEETPLNLKQFFEVFRADTSNFQTSKVKEVIGTQQLQGSLAVSKIIDRKRAISLKHFNSAKYLKSRIQPYNKLAKLKKIEKKKIEKSVDKSKSHQLQDSFVSYKKIQNSISHSPPHAENKKDVDMTHLQYVSLVPKKITSDVLQLYIPHIISQLPVSSKSFTNYHTFDYTKKLVQTLLDPTIHTIIFQLKGQKSGKLGDAIVIEQLSRNLRLRYEILFIGVKKFELLIHSIARIAQELLAVTMCEQVIWKCFGDAKDYVSQHFFINIDKQLKRELKKFGILNILQKQLPSYQEKQEFQRVYLMEGMRKRSVQQNIMKKNMMNNYRSLVIECKSVLLASNFKLRSETLTKGVIQNYREESTGELYVSVLRKIMTKYHMKQLKIASMSINDEDEVVNLVKNGPFLRSIFHTLLQKIKSVKDPQLQKQKEIYSQTSSFTNMTDLLNYLSYRQYADVFNFSFLNQSRFFLNHQLTFSQVNVNTSLEFILSSSGTMLILNNFRNHVITQLSRFPLIENDLDGSQIEGSIGYLLPTLSHSLELLIMSGSQFLLGCSESLDLFTYIKLFVKQSKQKKLYQVQQIALPDLSKLRRRINNVKSYEGFERLFPEREFYSASMLLIKNLWESFYPNSVISQLKKEAIIIDYPLILGFYDSQAETVLTAFLIRDLNQ